MSMALCSLYGIKIFGPPGIPYIRCRWDDSVRRSSVWGGGVRGQALDKGHRPPYGTAPASNGAGNSTRHTSLYVWPMTFKLFQANV